VGLVYSTSTKKFIPSYETLEKADWPVDGVISIKIKRKGDKKYVVDVVNGPEDGSEWKQLAIRNGEPVKTLGDWKDEVEFKWGDYRDVAASYIKGYEDNVTRNQEAAKANVGINQRNNAINAVIKRAGAAQGGDYLAQRDALKRAIAGTPFKTFSADDLEKAFNDFYSDQKIKKFNLNTKQVEDLSKLDPTIMGRFDANWYGNTYRASSTGPLLKDIWSKAEKNKDLDITETYGNPETYYFYHYTNRGKGAGNRGNPAEITAQAKDYLEDAPTDQEIQQLRDRQLGVNIISETDEPSSYSRRLLEVPYIADEWEKAKNGDAYWKQLAKDNYLNIEDADQFAALFRLSNRDEDKQVAFTNNLNSDSPYGISELEDVIAQAAGEKAVVDTKRFGALAQDTLKLAIDEIKKAKQKEQMLDLYGGFSGFSEIININDTLKDSLLGDLSMGGMLPLGDKFEESLEKGIEKVTGINNNVAYNWQEWFDETLSKRYQENLELGLTPEEADQKIQIESEFAKSYINDYLIPRFDESRSMDEFVEYIDVRQEEQNPFQTYSLLKNLRDEAIDKADDYIQGIEGAKPRKFDYKFYFNPTGNDARSSDYAAQSERVNSDWARAKNNPNALVDPNNKNSTTWAQQAYRFGIDLNTKNKTPEDIEKIKKAFAEMHFQIIGQGKGYDAAEDILSASKVKDYIYGTILPILEQQTEEIGTVFGEFIKPEEFADEILEGLDPNVPEDWEKVLEDLGMEDFEGSLDELKEYIAETLQTGSATDIRRSIKYLNEKREKPTQKNLGITYIEREEDEDPEKVKAETALYNTFVNAGYSGTEDEFYENFMPDVNREDMALLTSASKGEKFSFDFGDYSDPFASFASIQSFFPDEDGDKKKDDEEKKSDSGSGLFDLSLDLDSPSTKSKSAQSLLGEFTAGFKFN
jgi:hypothetical protein